MNRKLDKIIIWFVWKLPKRIVMWCGIRIGAHATQGQYSRQPVPDLLFMDAMKRWDD